MGETRAYTLLSLCLIMAPPLVLNGDASSFVVSSIQCNFAINAPPLASCTILRPRGSQSSNFTRAISEAANCRAEVQCDLYGHRKERSDAIRPQ